MMARRANRQAAGKRRSQGAGRKVPQLPWTVVRNRLPPIEIASADEVEAVHDASLRVLEDIGINILPEGGIHTAHIHPHSVMSGTTYVAMPKGAWMQCSISVRSGAFL